MFPAKKRKFPKGSAAPPRVVPGTASRPPLARMMRIHERLQEQAAHPGGLPPALNCVTLGEELEVNPKTVQRDVDFMRDRLGLPIDYDAATRGFRYSRPVAQFPTVQITEGELVALAVARQALGQYRGTPFERPLRAAFHKLTAGLRDQIQFAWFSDGDGDGESGAGGRTGEAAAISFRSAAAGRGVVTDLAAFEAVSRAVLRGEEVEFLYRKLEAATSSLRRVRPLHLACIDGAWYLFGLDGLRPGMPLRTFALSRLAELRPTGELFERPAGFSLEEHLANSFGVFAPSGPPAEVRLRFDPFAARLVQERTWHASQRLAPRADGGVDLTLQVGLSPEVERWVLGWGEHVEVVAPASLRARVADVARAVARTHGSDGFSS